MAKRVKWSAGADIVTEDELTTLFGNVRTFAWDENKRRSNVAKHGIDFADAEDVFKDPAAFTYRSSGSSGEQRYVTIGAVRGVVIAVVTTLRQETIRIISARRARRSEKQSYG